MPFPYLSHPLSAVKTATGNLICVQDLISFSVHHLFLISFVENLLANIIAYAIIFVMIFIFRNMIQYYIYVDKKKIFNYKYYFIIFNR